MILRLVITFLALSGALASAAAWIVGAAEPRGLPDASSQASAAAEAGPEAFAPVVRSQLVHLMARPPFAPDRRPLAEEEAEVQKEAPSPVSRGAPDARLLGVISDGRERIAVLATRNGPATLILRKGGTVDGWIVDSIDDDRVVLRNGEDKFVIDLFPGGANGRR